MISQQKCWYSSSHEVVIQHFAIEHHHFSHFAIEHHKIHRDWRWPVCHHLFELGHKSATCHQGWVKIRHVISATMIYNVTYLHMSSHIYIYICIYVYYIYIYVRLHLYVFTYMIIYVHICVSLMIWRDLAIMLVVSNFRKTSLIYLPCAYLRVLPCHPISFGWPTNHEMIQCLSTGHEMIQTSTIIEKQMAVAQMVNQLEDKTMLNIGKPSKNASNDDLISKWTNVYIMYIYIYILKYVLHLTPADAFGHL